MTDHVSQSYANKDSARRGTNKYEQGPKEPGIHQILAGMSHPQTNGKIERLHGMIQCKLHWYSKGQM